MFNHVEHGYALQELQANIVKKVGRLYTTPDGKKLPSITTVLGATQDNLVLMLGANEWVKKKQIELWLKPLLVVLRCTNLQKIM